MRVGAHKVGSMAPSFQHPLNPEKSGIQAAPCVGVCTAVWPPSVPAPPAQVLRPSHLTAFPRGAGSSPPSLLAKLQPKAAQPPFRWEETQAPTSLRRVLLEPVWVGGGGHKDHVTTISHPHSLAILYFFQSPPLSSRLCLDSLTTHGGGLRVAGPTRQLRISRGGTS